MGDWTELPEFDGVDLAESYVLGWHVSSSELQFELDVVLVPGHPEFAEAVPEEWACYRRGSLTFPKSRAIEGLLPQEQVRASIDASGERDYGNIEHLEEKEGRFYLRGDFGEVCLQSGRPYITLVPVDNERAG